MPAAAKTAADATGELLLGRYRLDSGPVLGQGGWCIVRRAEDCDGRAVAVKTFTAQAARELGDEELRARFQREVRTFQAIGAGPSSGKTPKALDPRHLFVNLLDFSKTADGACPGAAPDGQYYTVLELADDSLDAWLKRCADRNEFIDLQDFCKIAYSIAEGLAWLHSLGFVHLDLKPENIMRFGNRWKMIDLEGCLSLGGTDRVKPEAFTPLYASPELASAVLQQVDSNAPTDRKPMGSMDTWAAGVVLLDVLSHGCCFAETKASYDAAALFEEEAIPFEGWYRWLAAPGTLEPADFLAGTPGAKLLEENPKVKQILGQLLEKDPSKRLSAAEFKSHPLLAPMLSQGRALDASGRDKVELVFGKCQRGVTAQKEQRMSHETLMTVLLKIGAQSSDAAKLLDALSQHTGTREFSCEEFLDVLYDQKSYAIH